MTVRHEFHHSAGSGRVSSARRRGSTAAAGLVILLALALSGCTKGAATGDSVAGGAAATGGRGGRGGRGAGGGAQPVVTGTVALRDMPVDIAAVGNVEAYTSVSVRSQVT